MSTIAICYDTLTNFAESAEKQEEAFNQLKLTTETTHSSKVKGEAHYYLYLFYKDGIYSKDGKKYIIPQDMNEATNHLTKAATFKFIDLKQFRHELNELSGLNVLLDAEEQKKIKSYHLTPRTANTVNAFTTTMKQENGNSQQQKTAEETIQQAPKPYNKYVV
jgi:hypothetical protein